MSISQSDLKLLLQRSGNRCAFPTCTRTLTYMPGTTLDFGDPTVVSEIAHIVSRSLNGPRGGHPLPLEERDQYDNLILLCQEHHTVVDSNEAHYTVERLQQMKHSHESAIEEATGRAVQMRRTDRLIEERAYITEIVHSPVLPVSVMPRYIYKVTCAFSDRDEKKLAKQISPRDPSEMCPFIIRSGWAYCFQNLETPGNAFEELTQGEIVECEEVSEWLGDPDRERMLQDLLNRALNKLTGRKGLNFDRDHRRYYFMPKLPGEPLKVKYRPMNRTEDERFVVWQPITKKTGRPKHYWQHRAVQLRFERVSASAWVLTIRPGFHISADGVARYPSDQIGKRVNKKMIRLFNYELLTEIHFWRDYLSGSRSHIILPFGEQSLQIESRLLPAEVTWPGIPEEHAKNFTNANYETDMFTQLELDDLALPDDEDDLEDWEFD